MNILPDITYFIIILLISYGLIKVYIKFCIDKNIFNIPKNLSKNINKKKIPTSAGIVIFFIFIFFIFIFYLFNEKYFISIPRPEVLIGSIILLGAISFADDLKSINPIYRFIFQTIIVFLSLTTLESHVIKSIPFKLSLILIIYFWIYYINIINFIDGIDGFAISHVIFVCLATIISCQISNLDIIEKYFFLILLPISIGFLILNKPPAKVFMGDSGSIVFGYLIGWLTIRLVQTDLWFVSLIIIMYPALDVTLTILTKISKGKKPWERLFDYFFLQGVKNKKISHLKTIMLFNLHNVISLILVVLSFKINPIYTVALALISSTILIMKYNQYKIK
jgi:UDP-N-acetylmuramyl pentapeptide phosphotransferase/UDP-N-acetylglucosamine-1-phosphate transferase